MSVNSRSGADKSGERVLIFFPRNPYPFTDGNLKRFKQVLEAFLQRGARVYLLSSNFFNGPEWNEESVRVLKAMGVSEVYIYRMSELEIKVCRFFYNGKKGRAIDIFYAEDLTPPLMKLWFLKNALMIKPEIVIINYIWWSRFLGFFGKLKPVTVIEMHDLVTVSRAMRVELKKHIGRKLLSKDDFEKIPDYFYDQAYWAQKRLLPDPREMRGYDQFNYTVAISGREAGLVEKSSSKTKVILAPYSEFLEPIENSYGDFVLFPAGKHPFNLHAYLYFFKKIWPGLKKENPDFKLKVTGGLKDRVFEAEGIELLDFVPDMEVLYRQCRFVICPVIAGTGQVIKVVEALAHGLPVVTTRFASEDSALTHGVSGYIAENAEDFVLFTGKLWNDPELCRRMGTQARESSRQNFANNSINNFADQLLRERRAQ